MDTVKLYHLEQDRTLRWLSIRDISGKIPFKKISGFDLKITTKYPFYSRYQNYNNYKYKNYNKFRHRFYTGTCSIIEYTMCSCTCTLA